MTDYANDWIARRAMIAHAETSQGCRHIKDPIAHTKRMVKRYGEIYREAVGAAYGFRSPTACSANVRDMIDEELSARHGWKTIKQHSADSLAAYKERYHS